MVKIAMFHNYSNLFSKVFKKFKKISKLSYFNTIAMNTDDYIITKDLNYLRILEIKGLNYSNKDESQHLQYFEFRNNLLKQLDENILINIVTKKIELVETLENFTDGDIFEETVFDNHNAIFETSYIIKYYFVVQNYYYSANKLNFNVANGSKVNKLEKLETLNLNIEKIKNQLAEFKIRELDKNERLSFYSSYINGRELYQVNPRDNIISDQYINSKICFEDNFLVFENIDKVYSQFLSIYLYDNENFDDSIIEKINSLKGSITIFQSFVLNSKDWSLEYIDDKIANFSKFQKGNSIAIEQMQNVQEFISSGELNLFAYKIAIQVKDKSKENLSFVVGRIERILNNNGYRTILENSNLEPTFFSQLPDNWDFNVRQRILQNRDIATLNNFSTLSKGITKNAFGNNPITKFFNDKNNTFYFNLHDSEEKQALAHSIVVGGSNSGKTTFMTFVLSQIKRYGNVKILILDRLNGCKIFTQFYNGEYCHLGDDNNASFNPLQLNDTKENRLFLQKFLCFAGKTEDTEDEKIVIDVIDKMYSSLKKSERNFTNLLSLYGASHTKNDLSSRMEKFSNVNSNHFFYNTNDTLTFDKDITTIDMSNVFLHKEMIPLVTSYLFHRIQQLGQPFVIFIDEIKEYIENEYFLEVISVALTQYRKLDGVVILATQSINYFTDNEKARNLLGANIANYILYGDSTIGDKEKDLLKLTDTEFINIKNLARHKILFKQVGGESNILNVSLNHLGNNLKIFNSDASNVRKIMKYQKENYSSWKKNYLEN